MLNNSFELSNQCEKDDDIIQPNFKKINAVIMKQIKQNKNIKIW